MKNKKRIAIIGSGISGLSCAYLLGHDYDVTIFEAEDKLGGHCHTQKINESLSIDMGFIVFNTMNYPNLLALFGEINAAHELSDMSFGISDKNLDFEYSSISILAQKRNVLRPRFYKMLSDLMRFYKLAPLENMEKIRALSLGEYLKTNDYCQEFCDLHLLPQAAAIWSCSPDEILEYPFASFLGFFKNHGLFELDMKKRTEWRTMTGGSQNYVEKLVQRLNAKIHVNCPIDEVWRKETGIEVFDIFGNCHQFDEIVFATHADISARLLKTKTDDESRILSKFKYTKNEVILHTDAIAMPKRRKAWASWNYLIDKRKDGLACVSYWMNLLQNIRGEKDYFVTLNPFFEIDPSKIIAKKVFDHPKFDKDVLWAQNEFQKIQAKDRIWYCGAYLGFGFHEDGAQSGLWVGEKLGGRKRPWHFDISKSRLPKSFETWQK